MKKESTDTERSSTKEKKDKIKILKAPKPTRNWGLGRLLLGAFLGSLLLAAALTIAALKNQSVATAAANIKENTACTPTIVDHSKEFSLNEFPVDLTDDCWTIIAPPRNWGNWRKEWDSKSEIGDKIVFQMEGRADFIGPTFWPTPLPDLGTLTSYQVKVMGHGRIRFVHVF